MSDNVNKLMYNGQILVDFEELADKYTKAEIDQMMQGLFTYKGNVATVADLNNIDTSTCRVGDCYNVTETGANYAWNGTMWDKLSETIDLSVFYTKTQVDSMVTQLNTKIDELNLGVLTINGIAPQPNGNFILHDVIRKLSDYSYKSFIYQDFGTLTSIPVPYQKITSNDASELNQVVFSFNVQKGLYINDFYIGTGTRTFSNINVNNPFWCNGNFTRLNNIMAIYIVKDIDVIQTITNLRNSTAAEFGEILFAYTFGNDGTVTSHYIYKYSDSSNQPSIRNRIVDVTTGSILSTHVNMLYTSDIKSYNDINQIFYKSNTTKIVPEADMFGMARWIVTTLGLRQFSENDDVQRLDKNPTRWSTVGSNLYSFNNNIFRLPLTEGGFIPNLMNWFNFQAYDYDLLMELFPTAENLCLIQEGYPGGTSYLRNMTFRSSGRLIKNSDLPIQNRAYGGYSYNRRLPYIDTSTTSYMLQVGNVTDTHSAYYVYFMTTLLGTKNFKTVFSYDTEGEYFIEYNKVNNENCRMYYRFVQEAYTDDLGVEHTACDITMSSQNMPTSPCHAISVTDNDGIEHQLDFYIVTKGNHNYSMFYSNFPVIYNSNEAASFPQGSYPLTYNAYVNTKAAQCNWSLYYKPNIEGLSELSMQNGVMAYIKPGEAAFMNAFETNGQTQAIGPIIPNGSFVRKNHGLYYFYDNDVSYYTSSSHSNNLTLLVQDTGLTEAEVDAKIAAAIDALNAEDTEY